MDETVDEDEIVPSGLAREIFNDLEDFEDQQDTPIQQQDGHHLQKEAPNHQQKTAPPPQQKTVHQKQQKTLIHPHKTSSQLQKTPPQQQKTVPQQQQKTLLHQQKTPPQQQKTPPQQQQTPLKQQKTVPQQLQKTPLHQHYTPTQQQKTPQQQQKTHHQQLDTHDLVRGLPSSHIHPVLENYCGDPEQNMQYLGRYLQILYIKDTGLSLTPYRVVLSDGVGFVQALLASHLTDLVMMGRVRQLSVIRVHLAHGHPRHGNLTQVRGRSFVAHL